MARQTILAALLAIILALGLPPPVTAHANSSTVTWAGPTGKAQRLNATQVTWLLADPMWARLQSFAASLPDSDEKSAALDFLSDTKRAVAQGRTDTAQAAFVWVMRILPSITPEDKIRPLVDMLNEMSDKLKDRYGK
ncbi:MAG: hypothetical protein GC129_07045 [Proteobacteria bacterium]|nr:hypothetical protein [Pseudomonadota bacterium]